MQLNRLGKVTQGYYAKKRGSKKARTDTYRLILVAIDGTYF